MGSYANQSSNKRKSARQRRLLNTRKRLAERREKRTTRRAANFSFPRNEAVAQLNNLNTGYSKAAPIQARSDMAQNMDAANKFMGGIDKREKEQTDKAGAEHFRDLVKIEGLQQANAAFFAQKAVAANAAFLKALQTMGLEAANALRKEVGNMSQAQYDRWAREEASKQALDEQKAGLNAALGNAGANTGRQRHAVLMGQARQLLDGVGVGIDGLGRLGEGLDLSRQALENAGYHLDNLRDALDNASSTWGQIFDLLKHMFDNLPEPPKPEDCAYFYYCKWCKGTRSGECKAEQPPEPGHESDMVVECFPMFVMEGLKAAGFGIKETDLPSNGKPLWNPKDKSNHNYWYWIREKIIPSDKVVIGAQCKLFKIFFRNAREEKEEKEKLIEPWSLPQYEEEAWDCPEPGGINASKRYPGTAFGPYMNHNRNYWIRKLCQKLYKEKTEAGLPEEPDKQAECVDIQDDNEISPCIGQWFIWIAEKELKRQADEAGEAFKTKLDGGGKNKKGKTKGGEEEEAGENGEAGDNGEAGENGEGEDDEEAGDDGEEREGEAGEEEDDGEGEDEEEEENAESEGETPQSAATKVPWHMQERPQDRPLSLVHGIKGQGGK